MYKPYPSSNTLHRQTRSVIDIHQQDFICKDNNQQQNISIQVVQQSQKLSSPVIKKKLVIETKSNLFFAKKSQMVTSGRRNKGKGNSKPLQKFSHQFQVFRDKDPTLQRKYKLNSSKNEISNVEYNKCILKNSGSFSDSSEQFGSHKLFHRKIKQAQENRKKGVFIQNNKEQWYRQYKSMIPKSKSLNNIAIRCPQFLLHTKKKIQVDSSSKIFQSHDLKSPLANKNHVLQQHNKISQFHKYFLKNQQANKRSQFCEQNKYRKFLSRKYQSNFPKLTLLKMGKSLQKNETKNILQYAVNQLKLKKQQPMNDDKLKFKALNKKIGQKHKVNELGSLTKIIPFTILDKKTQKSLHHFETTFKSQKLEKLYTSEKHLHELKQQYSLQSSPKAKSDAQLHLYLNQIESKSKMNKLCQMYTDIQCTNSISKEKSITKIFSLNSIVFSPSSGKKFQFIVLKILAEQTNSQTYLVIEIQSRTIYCLKKLMINNIESLNGYIKQYKIQSFISHPFAVKLYGTFYNEKNLFLLMEYMEEQSLIQKEKFMRKRLNKQYHIINGNQLFAQSLMVQQKMQWIRLVLTHLLKILNELHSIKIIHRDVKPGNILVSYDTYKLGDFGSSTKVGANEHIGTLDYAAPQILSQRPFDQSIDMWSLGCIAYQLDVGYPPFFDYSRQITKNKILQLEYNCNLISSQQLKDFIKKLLCLDHKERLTASKALNHKFIFRTQNSQLVQF